jgi:hypothetical protein
MEPKIKVWFTDSELRGAVARRPADGESLEDALKRWALVFLKEFHRRPTDPVPFVVEYASGHRVAMTVTRDKRKRATVAVAKVRGR